MEKKKRKINNIKQIKSKQSAGDAISGVDPIKKGEVFAQLFKDNKLIFIA